MKSKYNHNPSLTYSAATTAISHLLALEGIQAVQAATAQVMHQPLKNEYQRTTGLTQRTGHVCLHRLFGAPKCPDKYNSSGVPKCGNIRLPVADHLSEWVDERGITESIVTHPWVLSGSGLREIVQFCDDHRVNASIRGGSWKYFDRRLLVEFKK
jgi:hypothetical protein